MTIRLLGLGALLPLLFLGAGCCATNQLWNFVSENPVGLRGASITDDDVLHLAVRYDFGRTWYLRAPLERGVSFPDTKASFVRVHDGRLPPSARKLSNSVLPRGDDDVSVYFQWSLSKNGELSHNVWVHGQGYDVAVELPRRVDWASGLARVGVLPTPLALAVDVVAAPIWVGWCFLTAGCHGPCPLPWCNEPPAGCGG
ncbi:MAG: hypothetical protein QNJ90_01385 [Planctomycetota bacterium]|nr:hypothetical protein [Planctomycetota bacterium]